MYFRKFHLNRFFESLNAQVTAGHYTFPNTQVKMDGSVYRGVYLPQQTPVGKLERFEIEAMNDQAMNVC